MTSPSEVKAYLKERRRASLGEIAIHFDTTADAAKALVEIWLAKARVRKVEAEAGACATTCVKGCCDPGQAAEVYEWVGP